MSFFGSSACLLAAASTDREGTCIRDTHTHTYTQMADRKDELDKKRQKLAELRKSREDRKVALQKAVAETDVVRFSLFRGCWSLFFCYGA